MGMNYKLIALFFITILSSTIGSFKVISIVRGGKYEKYFIIFIDTFIFGYLIKTLGTDGTFLGIVIFASGKTFGLLIAQLISSKIYKVIYSINIYIKKEDNANNITDWLFENDYSFTRYNGEFLGNKRITIRVHANIKQKDILITELENIGLSSMNIDITETKVYGKIKKRTQD